MIRTLAYLLIPVAALGACSDNPATNAAADAGNIATAAIDKTEDVTGAVVGGVSAPLSNTAPEYVTAAAIGDMYEIESSKLALERSQSAEIKKFAQQMITDHTATAAKLKTTVAEAKLDLTPPTELDARRKGMLDNLRAASPDAFDRMYLDQQGAAHLEALTLHTGFADKGDNDMLKKLAAATAPKIRHHGEMVKHLDSSGSDEAK